MLEGRFYNVHPLSLTFIYFLVYLKNILLWLTFSTYLSFLLHHYFEIIYATDKKIMISFSREQVKRDTKGSKG